MSITRRVTAAALALAVLLTAAASCNDSPHYANCDEAEAAGAAPLHRDDPGYRPELDRNRDGIACQED